MKRKISLYQQRAGLTGWRHLVSGLAIATACGTFAWTPLTGVKSLSAAEAEIKEFKTLTPSPFLMESKNRIKLGEIQANVRGILGGNALGGNETTFDNYYTAYYFPKWTLTSEKSLAELPQERFKFIRDHLEYSAGKNQTAHDRLLDLTFDYLKPIVQDPEFHPAVRYNAMLVIGMLNATEARRAGVVGAVQLPEPYGKTLPVLVEEFKKADNNDAVRVAALLGITRHLEWDNYRAAGTKMPAPTRTEIVNALTELVQLQTPPQGRTPAGHTWLRRRAVEALAHTGVLGVDAKLAALIDSLITDDKQPLALRCTAAETIARMEYKAPVALPVAPTTRNLGYLAVVACSQELARLAHLQQRDKELSRISGEGGAGPVGGGAFPGGGSPGGATPGGGAMPGGARPGGGATPGGGAMPGGAMPGGARPGGGATPGGAMPGGAMPGGARPGGGAMPGGGGFPGGAAASASEDPKAYRLEYARRRLRAELESVRIALGERKKGKRPILVPKEGEAQPAEEAPQTTKGVISYAKGPDEKYVDEVIVQVQDVIKVVETPDLDFATFEKDLLKQMKKLEGITKPLVAKAPEAVAAEEVPVGPAPAVAPMKAPAVAAPMEEVPMAAVPAEAAAPTEAPPEEPAKAPPAEKPAEPPAAKM